MDAEQDTGTGRCVQVSRHEHREVQAQGRGTWTWAGCKCEHKNKVKKKNHSSDSLCKQVGRGSHNRYGQAWSGASWQAGVSTGNQMQVGGGMDRCCQAQACMGKMQTEK